MAKSSAAEQSFDLVFVRHAHAGEREDFRATGRPDHERPLTAKGKKDARMVGEFLFQLGYKGARIASSPYTRTAQTAEILAKSLKHKKPPELVPQLKPMMSTKALYAWVCNQISEQALILVGHEPTMSHFMEFILTTRGHQLFDIKKATVIILSVRSAKTRGLKNKVQNMEFRLKCFLRPSELKKLKKV